MPACAVALCRNYTKTTKGTNVKYFSFPRDPSTQEEWVLRCGRETEFNVNNSRICSEHFIQEDFERDLMNELLGLPIKRTLKPTALPTINIKTSSTALRNRSVVSNSPTIKQDVEEDHSDGNSNQNADDENGKQDILVTYHCNECARTNSEYTVTKSGRIRRLNHVECDEIANNKCKKSKKTGEEMNVNARRGVRKRKTWSRAAAFSNAQTSSEKLRAENLKLKKQVKEMQAVLHCDENKTDWETMYKNLKVKYDAMEAELIKYKPSGLCEEMVVSNTVDFHEYAMKPKPNDVAEKLIISEISKDGEDELNNEFEHLHDANLTIDQPIYIIEIPSDGANTDCIYMQLKSSGLVCETPLA
ncbi:hypothetical protein CHUAL_004836 [Chamberlinius hualienensis]